MNGDETVYGDATVTGTTVTFHKMKQSLVQSSSSEKPDGGEAADTSVPVFKDLKDQKITVGGDKVSGMNGDETIRGPAVVTGTHVVYNQNTKSNGVAHTEDSELQIDGTDVRFV